MKKKKQRGSTLVSYLFYTGYVLLIILYGAGMFFAYDWMNQKLAHFEAATQPAFRAEEVFTELFSQPDWDAMYDLAGIEDTKFEGKEAFLTYIEALVGDQPITFEPMEDAENHFRILANGAELGTFTLEDMAKPGAVVPDWQLGSLSIPLTRTQSVTLELQAGHTAYVNGIALDDSYTQEILSITAEDYLPAGTTEIRRIRQSVSGLLVAPQIIIADAEGNVREIRYEEDTGIFTEIPDKPEAMPQNLKDRAIAAGEAYCKYMGDQSNYRLLKYFASGTDAFREITSAEPWPQEADETAISRQSVSEYVRYAEDLFSARVKMTVTFTFEEEPSQRRSLDSIFFFQRGQNGWKVIAMTNEDITAQTRQVRLTFIHEETELLTTFCDSRIPHLYAPLITAPEGYMMIGWGEKVTAEDGSVRIDPIFTPSENGKITIPQDMDLRPMTLYPVWEEVPAAG